MLLKVGELAKRTGLTVRTLHHYDSIGLLRPSGRSVRGYRLYSRDDVARLHGIQTLRGMGLSLADVAQVLGSSSVLVQALTFVPCDFESDDLGKALARAGFAADQPACISWMGVTMYLTAEAVASTLRTVVGFAPGSCLCFDYRVPVAMLNPVERAINDVIEQRMAALGEPWVSAFDPASLEQQMLGMGFRTADSVSPEHLNARYFHRRKDGLRAGGGMRIMCATL